LENFEYNSEIINEFLHDSNLGKFNYKKNSNDIFIFHENHNVNEEIIKLRNLHVLDIREKITLEQNIDKYGLNLLKISSIFKSGNVKYNYN